MYLRSFFNPSLKILKANQTHLQLIISPIERHFGATIGNILRKTILRFTVGNAATAVRIKHDDVLITHEFQSLHGVNEQVQELLLNIKSLLFKYSDKKHITAMPLNLKQTYENNLSQLEEQRYTPTFVWLRKQGPCTIKASDIVCKSGLEIINKDSIVCTITTNSTIDITILVESGIGYVPGMQQSIRNDFIALDALYSPVRHVSFYVRRFHLYEEVFLDIQTTGATNPYISFFNAIQFIKQKFQFIIEAPKFKQIKKMKNSKFKIKS